LNVCERRIRDLDEIIDDPVKKEWFFQICDVIVYFVKNCVHLVTKKEWNILSSDELSEEKLA